MFESSSCCLSLLFAPFFCTESERSHEDIAQYRWMGNAGFGVRHTCACGGRKRASGRATMRATRNRGDRAIDKTPNAARPRLILQAYTHPLVFSLSSPTLLTLSTTIPFLLLLLILPPPPPLFSVLACPRLLFRHPPCSSYPSQVSLLSPTCVPLFERNAPFARKPTHPPSSRYITSLSFSFSSSLYLFSTLRIFSRSLFSTLRLS